MKRYYFVGRQHAHYFVSGLSCPVGAGSRRVGAGPSNDAGCICRVIRVLSLIEGDKSINLNLVGGVGYQGRAFTFTVLLPGMGAQ